MINDVLFATVTPLCLGHACDSINGNVVALKSWKPKCYPTVQSALPSSTANFKDEAEERAC